MGIIGILFGSMFSILFASNILNNINEILNKADYYFRLTIDLKHLILAIIIICINIYLSVLIPSLKASSTSVIQGIRNNKEIKNKKRKTILEKNLPVEGKIAINNIRRDGNKYKLITFLLVICITTFVSVSTYIKYEKETADLVDEYDVDAELELSGEYEESEDGKVRLDYKTILENYEKQYKKKIETIKYKSVWQAEFLVEPKDSIITNKFVFTYFDNSKSIEMNVIGLYEKTYNKYINKINAEYGDIIIYNRILNADPNYNTNEQKYTYSKPFKSDSNLKLKLICPINIKARIEDYEIIDGEIINGNCILTNEIIDEFKDLKTSVTAVWPTIFINMDTYDKLMEKAYVYKYRSINERNEEIYDFWTRNDDFSIRIKCDDIVEFKKYIDGLFEKYNLYIPVEYYSLENLEKTIYIEIIELISKIIITAIIIVGIVSTINTINASLIERKEDFNIMYRIGATKGNIKKILIYECIYMFVKALIISIILSIPIIYKIIKETEKVLVLDKLLIPFGSIGMFIGVMFVISLSITLLSTKMIKEE
jgi:putative ABC transport system permease protein